MKRATGCNEKELGVNSNSVLDNENKTRGVEKNPDDHDVPPDQQRVAREKFQENLKVVRENMKAKMPSDPSGKGFSCPESQSVEAIETSVDQIAASLANKIVFNTGGKEILMDDPRTLSEIFLENAGPQSAARVYGLSTESTDFLKDHPDFVTPGAHPMRVSHADVLGILKNFENVYLAHEVTVTPNFQLLPYVAPEGGMIHRIQVQLKKAFWDIFDENLAKTPPQYVQALSVFQEMKATLLGLLLPHNTIMRERIRTSLNVDEIKEAIRNETFTNEDFKAYANFIIRSLGQLCCPSRDPEIAALKTLEKPSDVFKGIMEMMDKMRLDMANFYLRQFRKDIVVHCVQAERLNLAEHLESEYRRKADGLVATRKWLLRHRVLDRSPQETIAKAFSEILNFNPVEVFPELLILDVPRCVELSNSMTRLSLIGAIILTVGALAQTHFQPVPFEFRNTIKKHMLILMPLEDMRDMNGRKFTECLERAAEQCVHIVDGMTKSVGKDLSNEEKESVRACVRDVGRPDHTIRNLLGRRIMDHASEVALYVHKKDANVSIPAGLAAISHELVAGMGELQRMISHNLRVYPDIYDGILTDKLPSPTYPSGPDEPWDQSYVKTIDMLRSPLIPMKVKELLAREKKVQNEPPSSEAGPSTTKPSATNALKEETPAPEKPPIFENTDDDGETEEESEEEDGEEEEIEGGPKDGKLKNCHEAKGTLVDVIYSHRAARNSDKAATAAEALANLSPNLEPIEKKVKRAKKPRLNRESKKKAEQREKKKEEDAKWLEVEKLDLRGFCCGKSSPPPPK